MSEKSKQVAYKKAINIVRNMGYDERIASDEYLNEFYKHLNIPGKKVVFTVTIG